MRKLACVFLSFLIIAGLCGCSARELEGTWEYHGFYDSDSIMELFVYMDLYEEEIALMDPGAIGYVETVTFREDGSYTIACDIEQSTALAEEYYRNALEAFFENRAALEQCYGVSFGLMDQNSFFGFYADMYGVEGFEGLVDMLTESTVDPAYLAEVEENGTCRVTGRQIYWNPDGRHQNEYVEYSLEDDTLILNYYDGEKVYTRK